MNMRKKSKDNFLTNALVFILIIGLSLLLYPTVSDYWNSFHQSEAVAGYVQNVQDMGQQKKDDMLAAAKVYNQSLAKGVMPDLNLSKAEKSVYDKTLDVTGTGIMAYVDIPKINTTLPIYHGTEDSILQVAIGHIPGTSLPVGGKGTHAVISGHRGLPYEVDQILTVLPDDVSALAIDPNKDYVTLVTCTPYGVNSHRLLVRGHRIPNKVKDARVVSEASRVDAMIVAPIIAVFLFIILLLVSAVYRRLRK